MKITISESAKAKVSECRNALAAALAPVLKSNQAYTKLESQQDKLAQEIAELESAAPTDRKAIASLSEKRTELELVQRRISEFASNTDVAIKDALHAPLNASDYVIQAALAPVVEKYVEEVAAGIRPYCSSDPAAVAIARNHLPAVHSLTRLCNPFFCRVSGVSILNARRALEFMDTLFADKLEWNHDPKFNASK
jgi:hypothetical protein